MSSNRVKSNKPTTTTNTLARTRRYEQTNRKCDDNASNNEIKISLLEAIKMQAKPKPCAEWMPKNSLIDEGDENGFKWCNKSNRNCDDDAEEELNDSDAEEELEDSDIDKELNNSYAEEELEDSDIEEELDENPNTGLLVKSFTAWLKNSNKDANTIVEKEPKESDAKEKMEESDAKEKMEESDAKEKMEESDAKEEMEESDAKEKMEESDAKEEMEESDAKDEKHRYFMKMVKLIPHRYTKQMLKHLLKDEDEELRHAAKKELRERKQYSESIINGWLNDIRGKSKVEKKLEESDEEMEESDAKEEMQESDAEEKLGKSKIEECRKYIMCRRFPDL